MAAISTFRLILAILLVNIFGFTLKYFGYDTFIIIAGFRFHLSMVLPLIILFPPAIAERAINLLSKPGYKRKFLPILWILLSPGILLVLVYISGMEIADPDYFYEFGLSSVFDYPIYLVWNFPQLLLLYLFLDFSTQKIKNKFFFSFLILFFLFLYEIIPADFQFSEATLYSSADFIISVSCAAFLFSAYKNVYWFAITLFSAFWFNLLAFGSGTAVLVNLLFAAQYKQWEGFIIIINKDYKPYLLAVQLLLLFILLSAFLPFRKTGKNTDTSYEISDIKTDITV